MINDACAGQSPFNFFTESALQVYGELNCTSLLCRSLLRLPSIAHVLFLQLLPAAFLVIFLLGSGLCQCTERSAESANLQPLLASGLEKVATHLQVSAQVAQSLAQAIPSISRAGSSVGLTPDYDADQVRAHSNLESRRSSTFSFALEHHGGTVANCLLCYCALMSCHFLSRAERFLAPLYKFPNPYALKIKDPILFNPIHFACLHCASFLSAHLTEPNSSTS
jgi:hypothetical protein